MNIVLPTEFIIVTFSNKYSELRVQIVIIVSYLLVSTVVDKTITCYAYDGKKI